MAFYSLGLQVYTVRVDDTSTERKTAALLLVRLEAAITEVEERFNIKVVAVVTDASGECRKARRDLLKNYPYIVVIDCYAHQVRQHIIIMHLIGN